MLKKGIAKNGFSLLEILISLGIFSLLVVSVSSLALGSFSFLSFSQSLDEAEAMAEEAVVAVKSIGKRNWNEFVFDRSAIDSSSGQWILVGEGTTDQSAGFTRTIDFQSVFRDSTGAIASSSSPGAEPDALSKLVTVNVTWRSERGLLQSVDKTFLISDWRS